MMRFPLMTAGCSAPHVPHFLLAKPSLAAARFRARRLLSYRAMAMTAVAGNKLKQGIAEFYDESSGVWENIWGEHMHHGFYDAADSPAAPLGCHRAAQIRMVDETLRFAGVSVDPLKKPKRIVDVGCGIGGSSRYLARRYGAQVEGITLSPVQAKRAQELSASDEDLANKQVSFQVADALKQPFPDSQFDLVWAMESGEHMPDKEKFVRELARVAAPGANIIIVTWCHRDLLPAEEEQLRPDENDHLNKICKAYYLPKWCSAADYVQIARSLLLQDIRTADWTENVAPFWPAVIRSSFTWHGLTSLLQSASAAFFSLAPTCLAFILSPRSLPQALKAFISSVTLTISTSSFPRRIGM